MTVCLTVLYPRGSDPDGLYRRYRDEHAALVEEILRPVGLVSWSFGRTLPLLDKSRNPYELIANLYFERPPEEVLAALSSPAGERLAKHALSLTDQGMDSFLSVVDIAALQPDERRSSQ